MRPAIAQLALALLLALAVPGADAGAAAPRRPAAATLPASAVSAAVGSQPAAAATQEPADRPIPEPEPVPDPEAAEDRDEPVDRPGDEPAPGNEGEEDEPEAGDADKDEPKWDVQHPPGPSREVPIDVERGTWMSLDVSPDGRRVVFDLLGDLYALPIEGGEASPLTSGVAWDMQPAFSPDGRWIAFTSDRGGGDNLWVMPAGGGEPRQVTEESFRLLNSPAWTPDGRFIAGRKHFTSARSLGAGEIWIYHSSGGSGLQMTERPNDQKDLGEPAFSPDGRYLYYSRDVTPGAVFEYDKDPNPGIYAILRLDRDTGDTVTLVGGAGGAVRPTPSPDGSRLAFVRRVRGHSELWLKDLASGEEWPLWNRLDRDMQETWAIHGVYPRMAWTPDSAAVVAWAAGGLWRIEAATGEATPIPFHVRDTRTVFEPLRFPVEVAPERFDLRMLRWVTVSPAGDRAVFQALGKLWVRELPDGAPRRLTADADRFEHFPSFSRDGRWIVYTAWSDRELGSVRMAPAGGGATRTLTTEPGHYAEPVFTPDGTQVVYRKAEGGGLTSPLWSADPGIYRLPVAGRAKPVLVTRDGADPHFGAASDRLFLTRDDDDRQVLTSIDLDGSDPHDHLADENAGRYRVSPDGRWVAWQERFNVYVTPFVATGKRVDLDPEGKALPVKRVSRDAGDWLHWSGDSSSLHWSLGPELYTRRLADAFAFLEGAPETLPEPPAEGLALGFEVPKSAPTGTLALLGARLVTMRGDEVIDDGAVIVEGDRIRAVGRRGEVEVPAGAEVVELAGKTVIPGLIDVHWHGPQAENEIIPQRNWVDHASLGFGVTTIHDPSSDTATVFAASEMARAGLILAPRIFSTGTILYGAETPFQAVIDGPDDAASHLRRMKAVGAFSVKSYNQPRRDQRQQVIAAARELGMMVVPEGGSLLAHDLTMVVDGHTGVEHSLPVAAVYDDVLQLWGATPVGYTPTLGVAYGGLFGENYWYATTEVWNDRRLLGFVPREVIDARARRRVLAPEEEWNHRANARVAAALHHAGVEVQLGAHGQREGLAAHWEMWMLEQGGLTPHQALRAATLDGARYLGLDRDLGSIEPGKLADLAILGSDPLTDLGRSRDVERVVLGGRLYDAATLDRLWPDPEPRQPYFWQRGDDGRLLLAP